MEVYGCVLYVVDVIEVSVMTLFVLDAFLHLDPGEASSTELGLLWTPAQNDRTVRVCADH